MNKTFKVIYNCVRGARCVVSESAKTHTRGTCLTTAKAAVLLAALTSGLASAYDNGPSGTINWRPSDGKPSTSVTGSISNEGRITIEGNGQSAAVGSFAGETDAVVTNKTGGTISINAGTGANGINSFVSGTGNLVINNAGTVSIHGNGEQTAVGSLVADGATGSVTINNLEGGKLDLNDTAFSDLTEGVSFVNSGMVEAESSLMFDTKGETEEQVSGVQVGVKVVTASGEKKTVGTSSFTGTVTNKIVDIEMKEGWAAHAEWKDGKLVFTNVAANSALSRQIVEAFKGKLSADDIEFTGEEDGYITKVEWAETADGGLTFDKAVWEALGLADGDVVVSESLHVEPGNDVVVGSSSSESSSQTFGQSVGFKSIIGANKILVNDGKMLTLVGDAESEAFALADGAPVTVAGNGAALKLGFASGETATKGSLGTVNLGVTEGVSADANAKMTAENGTFTVAALNQAGKLTTAETATLTVANLTAYETASIENNGTLTIEAITSAAEGGSITNNKTLTLGGGEFKGQVINEAGAMLSATGELSLKTLVNEGELLSSTLKVEAEAAVETAQGATTVADTLLVQGTVTNNGTLDVGDMTLTSGEVTNNGDFSFDSLTVEGGMIGGEKIGMEDSAGALSVTGGIVDIGTIIAESISNSGEGTLKVETLSLTGSLTSAATTSIGTLTAQADSVIRLEGGTLTVDTLGSTKGAVYTQVGGTLTVNEGWFDGATLNIEAGTLVREDLGANTVNINDQGKVTVEKLTSDTKINVGKGGSLTATVLELNANAGKTISLNGGKLATTLDQVFTSVTSDSICGEDIEGNDVSFDALPGIISVGAVKDSVSASVDCDGCTLSFGDDDWTQMAVNSSSNSLGQHYENIKLEFTGTKSEIDGVFNIAYVNGLEASEDVTFVSFSGSELVNDSGNTTVMIGNGEGNNVVNVFEEGVGFGSIAGTQTVQVTDGKMLMLVGSVGADSNIALVHKDDMAGSVTVDAGAMLILGNGEVRSGHLEEITLSSGEDALEVRANGNFAVNSINGTGTHSVSVGENAVLNAESMDLAALNLEGAGSLFAVEGSIDHLINEGHLVGESLTITSGANSASISGTGERSVITVQGAFSNTGMISDFTEVTVHAGFENMSEGKVSAETLTLEGGSNFGTMTAENVTARSFTNKGTLIATNMDAKGAGVAFTNEGTLSVTGTLAVDNAADVTLAGTVTGGTLSLVAADTGLRSVGTLTITGDTYFGTLDLTGGDLTVAKGGTLAGVTLKDDSIGSSVTVAAGGVFGYSFDKEGLASVLDGAQALNTDSKAVAALSQSLAFTETGSLTVGDNASASGKLNLGDNALMIYTGETLDLAEGTTLTVTDGAQALFTKTTGWGQYVIVSGLDESSSDAVTNLEIVDKNGNTLTGDIADGSLTVTVGTNDIRDKDAAYGLANNINSILMGGQDEESELADVKFLSQTVTAANGAKASANLQELSAQAGTTAESYRLGIANLDAAFTRALEGNVSGAWVKAIAGTTEVDGFDAHKGTAGYDADTYGVMVGADAKVAEGFNVGAAFAYSQTDISASTSATDNDLTSYGLALYGSKTWDNGLTVALGFAYTNGENEITQHTLGTVSADADTTVYAAGVRAAYGFKANDRLSFKPYVGVDVVRVTEDSFTAKIDGAAAFRYEDINETVVRVPVGVRADFAFSQSENKSVEGFADLAVVPQLGGTDTERGVVGVNTGASDTASYGFADDVIGSLKFGASARWGGFDMGLQYGMSLGDVRELSHEITVRAKYAF